MDKTITRAEKNDLEEILKLQYLAYQSEAALFGKKDIPPLKQTIDEVIEEYEHGIILKMTDEDHSIIGSVRAREENGTVYIGKLIVHPNHRRKGYGSRLLTEIETLCPKKRYELFTSTRSSSNIRLYESLGYHPFDQKDIDEELSFVYLEKKAPCCLNDMEIRSSTADDIELLMSIRMEMLKEVNVLGEDYRYDDSFISSTRRYFLEGDHTTVLALKEGKVVGCASACYMNIMPTYAHPTGRRAHLMNVYTAKGFRKKGVAKKMMDILIEEVWDHGATEISLDATEAGRPLYEKCGFKDSDECMVLVR